MSQCAETIAVVAGFQTTVLPISAALPGRLPAIAVKLNGVTAKTKPSSGRYSMPVPDAVRSSAAAPSRSAA
jgi:hypothetical protein